MTRFLIPCLNISSIALPRLVSWLTAIIGVPRSYASLSEYSSGASLSRSRTDNTPAIFPFVLMDVSSIFVRSKISSAFVSGSADSVPLYCVPLTSETIVSIHSLEFDFRACLMTK